MKRLLIRPVLPLLAVAYGLSMAPDSLRTASAAQINGFGCIVHGSNLAIAKANYAAQCSEQRADCDPIDGRWYCASVKMDQYTPRYVFDFDQDSEAPIESTTSIRDQLADRETPGTDSTAQDIATDHQFDATPQADITDQAPAEQIEAESLAEERIADGNNDSVEDHSDAAPTAADITDLILVTGQSNALGANTGYDEVLDRPHERVFAFTDQGWQRASLKQVWDLGWFPRTHPDSEPSNNFAFHFALQLASNRADRTVGFILATAPGQAIAHWRYQGEFYRSIESKVIDAINQLPHKAKIDGVLWHQGETDANDTQTYTDALYTLIYYLRTEPWADNTTPFICGETKQLAVNNRLNGLNRDSDPNTACVRASDLSTFADGHHFDAAGLRTLGARYADAYLNIVTR